MPRRGTKRSATSWIKRRRAKRAKTSSRYFKNQIKRTVNRLTETKQKWIQITEDTLTTTVGAKFFDPMQISRGDQRDNRDGNEIRPTGLHVKGYFHNNNDESTYLRMVVFKAKTQANFGTATDCFDDPNGDATAPNVIVGSRLLYYPLAKTKMTVMKDKLIKLGPYTSATNGQHTKFINMWIPLKGKVLFEGGTSGADNAFPRYHIAFFFAEADEDQIGDTVEINLLSRFFYKDM